MPIEWRKMKEVTQKNYPGLNLMFSKIVSLIDVQSCFLQFPKKLRNNLQQNIQWTPEYRFNDNKVIQKVLKKHN